MPDLGTIAHLDFKHTPACEVSTCIDETPAPAVAVLVERWGCCDRRRLICDEHRDLVLALREIHLALRCHHHGTMLCAHRAFTLEPLP